MSWHYLQEEAVVSWAESSLDGAPSALLRLFPTAVRYYSHDSVTATYDRSQFGMMCARSMVDRGTEQSMLSAADFPVRTLVRRERVRELPEKNQDCGRKWRASFVKWDRDMCLWKIARSSFLADFQLFLETWPRWGMMHAGECFRLPILARRICAAGFGFLPTPMKSVAGKSKKTLAAVIRGKFQMTLDRYLAINGYGIGLPNPTWVEWLMGWPMGWSAMPPLETDRFREWLRWHGKH